MPAPAGALVTVVGGDESEEFLRQSDADRAGLGAARGARRARRVPGRNHMDVLHELAERRARARTGEHCNCWGSIAQQKSRPRAAF